MSPIRRRNRGFTLIELLVVISIIAVLISILLPALGGALQQARKLKDQANQRAIGTTAVTYSNDDPDGILGPVHPMGSHYTGDGYAEYGGGPGMMRYVGWNEDFDPRTRPLNHIIYGKNGIVANSAPGDIGSFKEFQCPGDEQGWQIWEGFDTSPLETEPNSYYKGNGTAYRMNNLAFDNGTSLGIYGRPSSRIPDPAQTLAFMEARVLETIWTNDAWPLLQPGELTGYHRRLGFFNVIYSDAHAAFMDFGNGTYYQHIRREPPWDQDEDVRGSWGRMDCLPEKADNF